MNAPCHGQSVRFDSTLLAEHMEAAKLCATCPVIDACQRLLEDSQNAWQHRSGGPEGTWAGQLVIAGRVVTASRLMRVHAEEEAYSEEEARRAHALFWHGHRDEWTLAGERTYQRRAERNQRARRRTERGVA